MAVARNPLRNVQAVCFDWGGTLMSEDGPTDVPMAMWPAVAAIEGAREALDALSGSVPLAIATNASVSTSSEVEQALSRVGLGGRFAHVFAFADLGIRKAEPEFWQIVSRELGVPLPRLAMLGDSLEADVRHPRRFGVQAVWFNPTGESPLPSETIPTVRRLVEFAGWVKEAVRR